MTSTERMLAEARDTNSDLHRRTQQAESAAIKRAGRWQRRYNRMKAERDATQAAGREMATLLNDTAVKLGEALQAVANAEARVAVAYLQSSEVRALIGFPSGKHQMAELPPHFKRAILDLCPDHATQSLLNLVQTERARLAKLLKSELITHYSCTEHRAESIAANVRTGYK